MESRTKVAKGWEWARGGEGDKGEVLAGRERISVLVVMDTCDKTVQNTSRCVQDCTHTCSIV